MKFKTLTVILIVVFATLLFVKAKRDREKVKRAVVTQTQTVVPEKEKPAKKKKAPPPLAGLPAPAPVATPEKEIKVIPLPPPSPSKSRQIPKDHVEFELLGDRIAVAFGDVVLGRLESEMTGTRGLFKPTKSRLWPTNTIAFVIKDGIQNVQSILDALKYFNDNTDVQFVARTDESEGIIFEPWDETKCASYIGRIQNFQPIYVGPNCGMQEMLHEVMHALGFVHEQSRPDRDKYIRILWDNILDGFQNQFDIVPDGLIHPYTGTVFDFDFESVMLYRPESFAKSPGLKTIEALNSGKINPASQGLSIKDLERLHYLY